jgi:bifunctional enzyme CysN/CysC
MNAQAQVADYEFATLLQRQARTSLLRFIACGSVDHGKSTLLGRLESDSRKFGTQGGELDFSLLLDGLAAEREQKITIRRCLPLLRHGAISRSSWSAATRG